MELELFSKRLTRTIELLLDYYQKLQKYDVYHARDGILKDTFVEIMYFFAELKACLTSYQLYFPKGNKQVPDTT
jgi:hypothetical protein